MRLHTSGVVDDVMFAHSRPGRGDGSEAFTRSDLPEGSTEPGAESDANDRLVHLYFIRGQNKTALIDYLQCDLFLGIR